MAKKKIKKIIKEKLIKEKPKVVETKSNQPKFCRAENVFCFIKSLLALLVVIFAFWTDGWVKVVLIIIGLALLILLNVPYCRK